MMTAETNTGTDAGQADRLGRKQMIRVVLIILAVFAALGALFAVLFQSLVSRGPEADAPLQAITQYRYEYAVASNGMKLHTLATRAAYVTLETIINNVTLTDKVGANGHPVNGDGDGSSATIVPSCR